MKLKLNLRQKLFICALLLLAAVLSIFFALSQSFRRNYAETLDINQSTNVTLLDQQTFEVQKVQITLENGQVLELKNNGEALLMDQNQLKNRKYLSNDVLNKLFFGLNRTTFNGLANNYFGETRFVITIVTNFGVKTIVIDSSGDTPLPPDLSDVIDTVTDVTDDLNQPPSSPPPVPTPSPTPVSLAQPTPSPSSQPSPSPWVTPQPLPTPDPFDCSKLDQTGVTVSNIRCMDPEP